MKIEGIETRLSMTKMIYNEKLAHLIDMEINLDYLNSKILTIKDQRILDDKRKLEFKVQEEKEICKRIMDTIINLIAEEEKEQKTETPA